MNVQEQEKFMPDYAYKCRFCDYTIDVFKEFAAEWVIPVCPNCNTDMIRDYRVAGVHFKGRGWGGDK